MTKSELSQTAIDLIVREELERSLQDARDDLDGIQRLLRAGNLPQILGVASSLNATIRFLFFSLESLHDADDLLFSLSLLIAKLAFVIASVLEYAQSHL